MNTIERLSLTSDNYVKALELLEDRYENKQTIMTVHTKNLLKLRRVESNVDSLRRLYDDVQAQVRSLQSLGITEENYGTFLAPIIMELLPHEVQLNVNRTLDEELWNLTRLLKIIKCEINAREKCTTAMEQERELVRMFFLQRNHCRQLVYLLDKNLNRSVFSVRNLIGQTNVEQSLIQVHENSF